MSIHPHGYWLEISKDNEHVCDVPLCDAIIKTFKVKDAIDVGCGGGEYTMRLNKALIATVGFDGNPLTPSLTNGECFVRDFSEPTNIGKFDLVLSLEVGEHIPKEFEQIFIDNLCNASKEWICLSWGIIGQPGYGHVNNQSNEYIILEVEKRGFLFNEKITKYLRKNCTFDWFSHSIMVFKKI